MESDPSLYYIIIGIIILIILHGFFATGEILIISRSKKRVNIEGEQVSTRKSKKFSKMSTEPSKVLASMEAGRMITGLIGMGIIVIYFFPHLSNYLFRWNIPFPRALGFIIIVLVLAFLLLVFGNQVPKRIALQHTEGFALLATYPLVLLMNILKPFVFLIQLITNMVTNIFGVSTTKMDEQITLEEIRAVVDVGEEQGIINALEKEMIDSVINFDEKYAEDIMTARTEVFMINVDSPIEEYVGEMLELKYSRIPVFEEDIDNIIGLLYVKDYLLHAYQYGFTKVNLRKLIRPAYFIPERKSIGELFLELQDTKKHMAVLIDEYGGFSGIVTMEDILEEIVGDIDDEYDHDEPDIRIIDSKNFYARGSVSIKEMNSKIGTNFDETSDDYDTLGGLLISEIGYIPEEEDNKVIEIENTRFLIHRIEDKRIMTVRIELLDEPEIEEKELSEE